MTNNSDTESTEPRVKPNRADARLMAARPPEGSSKLGLCRSCGHHPSGFGFPRVTEVRAMREEHRKSWTV